MANRTIDIGLNLKNLDEATEKAKQLVGHLEQAERIIDSFPHNSILEATETDIDAVAGLIAEKLKEVSCKNEKA